MVETLRPHRIISFANFEVDLQAGELRRAGMRLKLTGQPFQVLAILLEHPGEVVTREELQKRLWPDTFVDVDHNLNTAINKIREVLGDSAENPQFVETLARRGYRFVGPVAQQASVLTQMPTTKIVLERSSRKRRRWSIALILCTVIAAGVLVFVSRPLVPPPRILAVRQVTTDGLSKQSMATDGSRIYFSSYTGNQLLSLYEVSVGGGTTVPIQTSLDGPIVAGILPSRSELLVLNRSSPPITDCPVLILPLLGQSPRRVGDIFASDATWSPSGEEIAYTKANSLYRAKADGTGSTKLASLAEGDRLFKPAWSPDGSRLRFSTRTPKDGTQLWEVSADGKDPHRLFLGQDNSTAECCGMWTPDGKYYVFQSGRGVTNVWVIREKKSFFRRASNEPVQLTAGPSSPHWPTVSPNGKALYVITSRPQGELVRYDSASHQLLPYLGGISAISVTFSANGKSVAYVTYPEGTLWQSKLDGSERVQLTFSPMWAAQPRWSPDGTQIAFYGVESDDFDVAPRIVYITQANGGSLEQPVPGDHVGHDPTWSPDGSKLLFGRYVPWVAPDVDSMELRTVDLRTHEVSTGLA